MLSQKLSRINFKMADLAEYERAKASRGKAMDTTPESTKLGGAAGAKLSSTKKIITNSYRSTPGGSVSFRSSTPEQSS